MRFDMIKARMQGMAFAVHPGTLENFVGFLNTKEEAGISVDNVANDSVEYEVVGNTAVISIDGGLYKKEMNGMCMSVASYDQIVKKIDKAESDEIVTKILFRVDTPGGAVAGVDEVGERIFDSSKETYTLYENMGASAGIWAFTAADHVFATEPTNLGSIGVMVSYLDMDTDKRVVTLVSKNAKNKNCSLNGDCKQKIENKINAYEDIFYSRVERNTGFTAEQIKTTFNNGEMIFATEAKEKGFIKDVTTFKKLLGELTMGGTKAETIPSDNVKLVNSKIGANMKFDRENLDATEQTFNTLLESRSHLNANIADLNLKLQENAASLEAKEAELAEANAKLSGAVSIEDAKAQADAVKTEALNEVALVTSARVEEAFASGVANKETVLAMIAEKDDTKAHEIALNAKPKTNAMNNSGDTPRVSSIAAYANKNKGSIK